MNGSHPLRHSIFARLVLLAILLAAALTFALWLLADTTIQNSNRMALERAVDVDLAGLVDIQASGGQAELVRRIKDRLALRPREGNAGHYMLADGKGRRLAGDVREWPGLNAPMSETGFVTLNGQTPAFARATQLAPDLRLLVAHDYGEITKLRQKIGFVFLLGGASVVLTVALGGWFAARRLAMRIERINAAFRQPDDDALDALVIEGQTRDDEIDELTRHSGEALTRLKQLANAHRETSDQIAHEMRTPLMHLDNRLVKALAATPDPETAARIADARSEIRTIIRMLESLLDIAASEARRGDRHGLAPVDLSSVALRLGELYADSAEESGHHFKVEIEPGVMIEGEEMQLTRLITNLLDNAFKYVPAGGTVWLRLAQGPRLSVSDDGPGIDKADRETIFERFHRGGSRPGEEGAGLGLALCRAIALRHGLAIELDSSERGASFTVQPEKRR